MDDIGNLDNLNIKAFVLFLDGFAKSGVEVPSGHGACVVTEVGEDFTVDFKIDFLSKNSGQLSFSVKIVL